jgi:hypothetical protein
MAWFPDRALAGREIRSPAQMASERGSIAAPLHNRNRRPEGLKNPLPAAFFAARRFPNIQRGEKFSLTRRRAQGRRPGSVIRFIAAASLAPSQRTSLVSDMASTTEEETPIFVI